MTIPSTTPSAPETTADGSTLDREVRCPLCDYDLRGLPQPRCPECGHTSTWEELQNAATAPQFLFEYGQHRNVSTLCSTWLHSLMPAAFWRDVRPTLTIKMRRLLSYAAVVVTTFGGIGVLGVLIWWYRNGYGNAFSRYFYTFFIYRRNVASSPAVMVFAMLLWPALTWATLMIFQETMSRRNIASAHIVRCVIYSADALFLPSLALVCLASLPGRPGIFAFNNTFVTALMVSINVPALVAIVLIVAIGAYRLNVAYRRYLCFPQAGRAVAASQAIVLLVLLNMYFLLTLPSF